jgi:hypothetical protein
VTFVGIEPIWKGTAKEEKTMGKLGGAIGKESRAERMVKTVNWEARRGRFNANGCF